MLPLLQICFFSLPLRMKKGLDFMDGQYIELKGVRVHNLKNINLRIGLNKLIVITGVSGSGKSSLAFDTLYAEGQRRYVESLSAYARQFLGRLNKPECDYIKGIPPAVAIEQRVISSNPRSTVGTSTEIYDYLKLLYARAGRTFSPVSGREVKRDNVDSITKYVLEEEGKTVVILCRPDAYIHDKSVLQAFLNKGFVRLKTPEGYVRIEDVLEEACPLPHEEEIYLVVNRLTVNREQDTISRISESVETALYEGKGTCFIEADGEMRLFSNRFEEDGMIFDEPSVNMFSFNSPIGACPRCVG